MSAPRRERVCLGQANIIYAGIDANSMVYSMVYKTEYASILSFIYITLLDDTGGDAGIRTLGTRKGSTVFETAPFDHSGTSPH